jgi:hypothetical protein
MNGAYSLFLCPRQIAGAIRADGDQAGVFFDAHASNAGLSGNLFVTSTSKPFRRFVDGIFDYAAAKSFRVQGATAEEALQAVDDWYLNNVPSSVPFQPGEITIDAAEITGDSGFEWSMRLDEYQSVSSLLDFIFHRLEHRIPMASYAYGEGWILRDAATQHEYRGIGRRWWLSKEKGPAPLEQGDPRSLADLEPPISDGMRLEVVSPS